MRKLRAALGVTTLVLAGMVGAGPIGASASAPPSLNCTGGPIAPGIYQQVRVTGQCTIPSGVVKVVQGLVVDESASLDATNPAGTLKVGGDVHVKRGAVFGLGCSAIDGGCTPPDNDIAGELAADHPLALLVYSTDIGGHFALHGGSGAVNCDPNPALGGAPVFSAIEDNLIKGGVSISGYQGCWFGFIRNTVRNDVSVNNNTFADPDATEVVGNKIFGDLVCHQNSPAAQIGDSMGAKNTVSGEKVGQCAHL